MLNNIQVLRGIAALLVVWVHTQLLITAKFVPLTVRHAGFGGVDLFFVISGFIIVCSTAKGTSSLTFAQRRFFRVAPLYYAFTALVVLNCIFLPDVFKSTQVNFETVAKSLLFIPFEKSPNHVYPMYPLGWTLNYEMFFYFLFTLALLFGDARKRAIGLTAALVVLTLIGRFIEKPSDAGVIAYFYTRPIILEFAFGMTIAAVQEHLPTKIRIPYYLLLVAGLMIFLFSGLVVPNKELIVVPDTNSVIRFGVPSAMIVTGAVGLERCHHRIGNSILRLLGDASYSIYLSHFLVVAVLGLALSRLTQSEFGTLLGGLVIMVIAEFVGVATYRWMERPLLDGSRRLTSRSKPSLVLGEADALQAGNPVRYSDR